MIWHVFARWTPHVWSARMDLPTCGDWTRFNRQGDTSGLGSTMGKSHKFISGIPAETPVSHAARDVLDARLEAVRYFLPRAAYSYNDDPEHVHQLRVSTRRAV